VGNRGVGVKRCSPPVVCTWSADRHRWWGKILLQGSKRKFGRQEKGDLRGRRAPTGTGLTELGEFPIPSEGQATPGFRGGRTGGNVQRAKPSEAECRGRKRGETARLGWQEDRILIQEERREKSGLEGMCVALTDPGFTETNTMTTMVATSRTSVKTVCP